MTISIRTKLLTVLALNLICMLALGAFAARQMWHMNAAATSVHAQAVPARNTADGISELITRYRALQLEYLVNVSAADHARIEHALGQVEQEMALVLQRYPSQPDSSQEHQLFERVRAGWEGFVRLTHDTFLPTAQLRTTGSVQPYLSRTGLAYNELIATAQAMRQETELHVTASVLAVQQAYASATRFILAVTLATLVLSLSIGYVLATGIAHNVRMLTTATAAVAAGDLERHLRLRSRDELGVLAASFNQMVGSLREQRATLELRNQELEQSLDLARQLTHDLLKGKAAEEEAYRAKAAAESANEAKSAFLAHMSHELRTPLNAILGYTRVLRLEAAQGQFSELDVDLQRIQSAGLHLLALISDVLDLSKIEAGKTQLYCEEVDLGLLIKDVVADIEPIAAGKQNQLLVVGGEAAGTMYADLTRLRQILLNLLSNAAKFTEAGSITLAVSREWRGDAEWVRLAVSDTGIGIAPPQLARLFRPFTQADLSATRKYGGTGLGLALSRHFCQLMGGEITVTSVEGQGSTFTAFLPARVAERHAVPALGVAPQLEAAALPIDAPTVLLIDDDRAVHGLVQQALHAHGLRTITVAGGQQGLALARAQRIDLIILDVLMEELDGWSVLAILKQDPRTAHIPVIMQTNVVDQQRGVSLGAAAYLVKPIDLARLAALVREHLPPLAGAPASVAGAPVTACHEPSAAGM